MKASRPVTWCPAARSSSQRWEPMKPAAPVTTHFMGFLSILVVLDRAPQAPAEHHRTRHQTVSKSERTPPLLNNNRAGRNGSRAGPPLLVLSLDVFWV